MGVNNSVMRCVNDAGDRESDLITMRNLRLRNKDKRELQFGNRVAYLSPHIDSGDGSSSYFSPLARNGGSPGGPKDDRQMYLSSLPMQASRTTEMTMQRLKKLSTMIKLGNIEGLDYLVTKWQWQYDDIKFENMITPLILAVMSNQLPMVQFLVSQGVDMDHLDLVGRSAIDWSISCNYETIYYFLKSSVTKTASSTASSTSSQSLQSVQIHNADAVANKNRSFKSQKASNHQTNQRVVAFFDDSPEVRNTRRNSISYPVREDESIDDESFEKEGSTPGRRMEALKVPDHLSPLTQSSAGNGSLSVKKSANVSSPLTPKSNRSRQSKVSSGTPSKAKEKEKEKEKEKIIVEEISNSTKSDDQPAESASKKESSPDSVRKWMTKRIVAAAEAVIPREESTDPRVNKPRYTRSIRKATSKAMKLIWKKPKAIET